MAGDLNRSYDLYDAGCRAMARRDWPAAIGSFEQSLAEAPHFKTHELLGECLLAAQRPEDAATQLRAAVADGNKPTRAHYLLALALTETGDHDGARSHVRAALALNPGYKAAARSARAS